MCERPLLFSNQGLNRSLLHAGRKDVEQIGESLMLRLIPGHSKQCLTYALGVMVELLSFRNSLNETIGAANLGMGIETVGSF